jgi:hypothetical protein
MANYFEVTLALANTHANFLQSYRLFGSLILLVILYRLRADWRGRATTPAHPWLAVNAMKVLHAGKLGQAVGWHAHRRDRMIAQEKSGATSDRIS